MSKHDANDPPGKSEAKKERVLHTRVSVSLEDELKERANQLGVSVSNLVRNVLLNAFEMVEEIVADGSRVARAAKGRERSGAGSSSSVAASDIEEVLGWQTLVLNINALCSTCNDILPKGQSAAVAVYSGGGRSHDRFLCRSCLNKLSGGESSDV